jgi:hypothetical protein
MQYLKPVPTLIVGILIGHFVLPRVLAKVGS